MTTSLPPLRIAISGPGKYKSIDALTWDNVPPFAVLTGVNGSGKTQLLELLAYKLTGTAHGDMERVTVTVTGDTLGPESVAFIPSVWDMQGAPALGLVQMTQLKQQVWQQLQRANIAGNIVLRAKRARIEKLLGKDLNAFDQNTFARALPNDYAFLLEDADVIGGIAHVMMGYVMETANELLRDRNADIVARLGKAPWDLVNEALRTADFPYEVVPPVPRLDENYQFRVRDTTTGLELAPNELSSGEKAILRTLLWLFNSRHHAKFARLFLLDEPDAHLHPSMTQQFLTVVKNILVDRYNVRVIMSTHSPSTVALAPDGSVYEMYKDTPRIRPSTSPAHSIGLLTAGLVVVSRGTRFVFVEDEDDVNFYKAVWDVLTNVGLAPAAPEVNSTPSLVFLPASVGQGATKIAGGKDAVEKWVAKLNRPPLDEIFRGVIDFDTGNVPSNARVEVLRRYSIENYLLDPLIVYGLLVDVGQAPTVPGLKLAPGDEHLIRILSTAELQAVADSIITKVEPHLPALAAAEKTPTEVEFTNGQKVRYPAWVLSRQGHGLLPIYQSAFGGGANVITPPKLINLMRRVRMMPVELPAILRRLQT